MMFSVKEKIIIITGGLGLLGSEFAKHLLGQGAKIAIFDILKSDQKRVEDENIITLNVDVTDKDSIVSGLIEVEKKWGIPNGLINCAAIDFPPCKDSQLFEDYSESEFDKVMEVNVKGVFLCCQVIGTAMAMYKRGSIINISSIYGMVSPDQHIYEYRQRPFIKPISYSVSKSALYNLTRYLATYWGREGVRVNTLTLGGVLNNQDEPFKRNYSEKVPLGRMASKEEYNGAIQFLLSYASSYMTGANMIIDGGWTAW